MPSSTISSSSLSRHRRTKVKGRTSAPAPSPPSSSTSSQKKLTQDDNVATSSSSLRTSRRRRKATTSTQSESAVLEVSSSSLASVDDYNNDFSYSSFSKNSPSHIARRTKTGAATSRPSSSSSSESKSTSSRKKKEQSNEDKENQINLLKSTRSSTSSNKTTSSSPLQPLPRSNKRSTNAVPQPKSNIKSSSLTLHTNNNNSAVIQMDQHYLSILDDVQYIKQQTTKQPTSEKGVDTQNEITWNEIIESQLLYKIISISIPTYYTSYYSVYDYHSSSNQSNRSSSGRKIELYELKDEHIYTILNIARKCIRNVVIMVKNQNKQDQQYDLKLGLTYLRIAIHCIRSILSSILISDDDEDDENRIKMMKKAMKLLYHIITTIEDIIESNSNTIHIFRPNEKNNNDSDDSNICGKDVFICDVALIGLSSFQMLGVLLYSMMLNEKKQKQERVEIIYEKENKGRQQQQKQHHITDFFPVPLSSFESSLLVSSNPKRRMDNDDSKIGSNQGKRQKGESGGKNIDDDLTNEQIIKIAIQSLISTSIILWNIQLYNVHQSLHDARYKVVDHDDEFDAYDGRQQSHQSAAATRMLLPFTKVHEKQYGHKFCSSVLESIRQDDNGGITNRTAPFPVQLVLSQIATSWINLFIITQPKEEKQCKECAKTAKSFLSRMSKLLLDAGTALELLVGNNEKDSSSSTNTLIVTSLRTVALSLKQHSIMISLQYTLHEGDRWIAMKNNNSRIEIADVEKRFEKACYYATKFSISYQQLSGDIPTSLIHTYKFHSIIGFTLDEIMRTLGKENVGYTEYCSYRALHLSAYYSNCKIYESEDRTELFNKTEHSDCCGFHTSSFPYSHPKMHSCQNHDAAAKIPVNDALLLLFYTTLQLKECVLRGDIGDDNSTKILSMAERSIDLFRNTFFKSDESTQFKQLILCQSILSRLRLIPFVTDISKEAREGNTNYNLGDLFAFGRIIGECYAPLNYMISKAAGKEYRKYFDIALDAYLRAAAVLDAAAFINLANSPDLPVVDDCFNNADRYLSKCGRLAQKSDPQIVEYIAKAISNIAKSRIDKKLRQFSICPYVITLDLYSDLQSTQLKLKSQLFARYGHLASVLLSLEMKREACVALCHAASHLLLELNEMQDNTNSICRILLFGDEFYNGKIKKSLFQNRQLAQYLTKLAQLYISILIEPYTIKVNDQVALMLKKSSFGSKILKVSEWKDHTLLANIVGEFIGPSSQHLVLLNELLAVIAMSGSSRLLQDNGHLNFQRDFDNSMVLIVKTFGNCALNVIALYFAAASVMHSLEITCSFQSCAVRASYYVDRAYDAANAYAQQKQKDALKTVETITYKASISMLKHCLDTKGILIQHILEEVMHECSNAIGLICNESDQQLRSIMSTCYGNCLLWLLVRIYQHYISYNSSVSGSHKMTLILDYFNVSNKLTGFESVAIPALVKGELYEKAKHLVSLIGSVAGGDQYSTKHLNESMISRRILAIVQGGDDIDELVVNIMSFGFEMESFTFSQDTLHDLEKGFYLFKNFASKAISSCTEGQPSWSQIALSISSLWWMSNCQAILSLGFYEDGAIKRALKSARLSIGFCKQGLSFCKNVHILMNLPLLNDLKHNSFTVMFIGSNSLRVLFKTRLYDSYEQIAKIHMLIGEHKQAKRYAIASSENLNLIPKNKPISNSGSVEDMLKIINPNISCIRHMKMKNTIVDIFSQSTPRNHNDLNLFSLFENEIEETANVRLDRQSMDWLRESVQYFLLLNERRESTQDDFLFSGLSLISSFLAISPQPLSEVDDKMSIMSNIKDFLYNEIPANWHSHVDTMSKICLFVAKSSLQRGQINGGDKEQILSLLDGISRNVMVSNQCRCRAFYICGHEYLSQAREAGELQTLWMNNDAHYCDSTLSLKFSHNDSFESLSTTPHLPNLYEARRCFHQAVGHAGPASSILSRESMRCLALTSGPCQFTGELIHSSIGSSSRQKISLSKLPTDTIGCFHESDPIFSAFDESLNSPTRNEKLKNMYNVGSELVPSAWNFIAICLCPTGELLLSRLFLDEDTFGDISFKYHTECLFAQIPSEYYQSSQVMEDFLKPFEDIMERSKSQLSGIDGKVAETFNSDTNAKIDWWNEREMFDRKLSDLLGSFERKYFDDETIKQRIFNFCSIHGEDNLFAGRNLASRFEAACTIEDNQTSDGTILEPAESLQQLTVKQLKQRLEEFNAEGKIKRSHRKADLVRLLLNELEAEARTKAEKERKVSAEKLRTHTNPILPQIDSDSDHDSEKVTFLILDEHLCAFPFEGLPILKGKTVCRLPSFPFAVSILHRAEAKQKLVKAISSRTTFVLDPESNLLGTQQRISQMFSKINDYTGWNWDGVVGEKPSESFMQNALTQENGTFLYFGHGGGEGCFSRAQIESMIGSENDSKSRDCKSSVILMGCSSGILQSVNHQGGPEMHQNRIYCEPEGVALSYLCAGAPCVVGNLWDVTDRDIDRFSKAFLERLFLSDENDCVNIAQIIAGTRDVCKMKHIVGCAPVVYGVPVWMLKA